MGLLDFSLDNLDDPRNQGLLAMGLSMLTPKQVKTNFLGDLGQSGLAGLQTLNAAQQQERQNRQNDLQQLTGIYNLRKQQEFGRMLQAAASGQPYTPDPVTAQMEARMAELMGGKNLSNRLGTFGTPPPPNPPVPAPAPATAAPSAPVGQNFMGANPAFDASALPKPQAPTAGALGKPAGGVPMQAWLAMDPTGKAYMEQLAKDNAPQVLRQGADLVKINPITGQYETAYQQPSLPQGLIPNRENGLVTSVKEIPNYKESMTDLKGAETGAVKAAEAPYQIHMVTLANGATVPMTTAQLTGQAKGFPSAAGLPFVTPPQAAPKTAAVTVTDAGKSQQAPAQTDPWQTVPKRPTPQGLGQSTYDAAMTKLQADTASRLAEKYGAQADVAQNRQALNNQALELVDRADTGMGAAMLGDVKNLLTSRFGIPESDFKNDPAATAALNKDLMNAAVAKAKASFGAKMSTNEVNNMLKRGAPNGDMLASAIKFLLTTDNATAGYQIQQANNLGKYLSVSGDPLQFEAWHAKTFPLSKVLDNYSLPQAGTGASGGWKVERVQ